jgi:hypothetical protein
MARRRLACLAALSAAGAAGAAFGFAPAADGSASASVSGEATTAKRARYFDARREDPQAPDIRAVVVSNTDAASVPASRITFRIEIPNRPVLTEDMRIEVWIDTDDDRSTGLDEVAALPGADFVIRWDRKLHEDARLLRCAGSACRPASAPTFSSSYARGATFSVQAAELGETRRFRFSARAYSGGDIGGRHVDSTPEDAASWSYRLVVRRPGAPRGSRTLTVRFTVTRADGSVLTGGRVTCTAMVGGRRVEPRSERFVGRRATCVFVLPLSFVGKMIRGTITVVSGATRVTKTFQRTIR